MRGRFKIELGNPSQDRYGITLTTCSCFWVPGRSFAAGYLPGYLDALTTSESKWKLFLFRKSPLHLSTPKLHAHPKCLLQHPRPRFGGAADNPTMLVWLQHGYCESPPAAARGGWRGNQGATEYTAVERCPDISPSRAAVLVELAAPVRLFGGTPQRADEPKQPQVSHIWARHLPRTSFFTQLVLCRSGASSQPTSDRYPGLWVWPSLGLRHRVIGWLLRDELNVLFTSPAPNSISFHPVCPSLAFCFSTFIVTVVAPHWRRCSASICKL